MRHHKLQPGFSLIELVVVVAVITVLVGLVLPAFAESKAEASLVNHRPKLRTAGQGMVLHARGSVQPSESRIDAEPIELPQPDPARDPAAEAFPITGA